MRNRKPDYNLFDVEGPYQPLDFHKIGRFIARNKVTEETVLVHGLTLSTACFNLGWKPEDVIATGKYKGYKTAFISSLGTSKTEIPEIFLPHDEKVKKEKG